MQEENMEPVNENKLDEIYAWLDQITFSRPKKNISRDFSDGGIINVVTLFFFFLSYFSTDILYVCFKFCSIYG